MIKAIAFDFDGVLAESCGVKTAAFAKLFEPEGLEARDKAVAYHLAHEGVSRFEKFAYIHERILGRGAISPEETERLGREFAALVVEGVVAAPAAPGAMDFLRRRHGDLALYVISATPHEELQVILRRRGMDAFFKAAYGSPVKKAPRLRQIMAETGLQPTELLFVGDTTSDHAAAREAGCLFLGRISSPDSRLPALGCEVVPDLLDLDETALRLGLPQGAARLA